MQLLSIAQQPELVIPVGHVGEISNTKFSPDSKLIATSSEDNTIKIWDVATGRLLKTLYGHKADVSDLVFSNGSKFLYTYSINDLSNKVWNLQSGQVILQTPRFSFPDQQICISKDEKWALSVQQTSLGYWDLITGKLIDSFSVTMKNGSAPYFSFMAFSNDNKMIAGYDYGNKTMVLWDRGTRKLINTFKLDTKGYGAFSIRFSGNDKQLYIINSGALQIMDINSGKVVKTSAQHSSNLGEPFINSSGRFLFTGGYEQYYKVVNNDTMATSDEERYVYQPSLLDLQTWKRVFLKGINPRENVLDIKMDDRGKRMLLIKYDSIFIFRVESGKLIRQGTINSDSLVSGRAYERTAISPDGKYILSTDEKNTPALFSDKGKLIRKFSGNIVYDSDQYYSKDGKYIFTSTGNKQHFSWDIIAGKLSGNSDTSGSEPETIATDTKSLFVEYDSLSGLWKTREGETTIKLIGETAKSLSVMRSYDGKFIITYGSGDSTARIRDAITGELLHQTKSRFGDFSSPVLSKDGRFVGLFYSNTADQLDLMWENLQKEIDEDTTGIRSIAEFPNEVIVLEMPSFRQLFYLLDTTAFMQNSFISFSDGSNYFSIAAGHFSLWKTDDWQQLLSVENNCGTRDPDWSISPDGEMVLVSCYNNSNLFRLRTNELLYTLSGAVRFANFSDDGKRILTESDDKQLKIWDVATGKLLYTYYAFENGNYIVSDRYNRYDGTEEARKKLYYACGNEFIDLEQFKDQLWVPNLAERIMTGDSINAPKLSDLNICGLTPQVENQSKGTAVYQFSITPRRGGLGETVVYVNGIEAKRYKPTALKKTVGGYELHINKSELQPFFIPGKENPVTVKAFTADNTISSRGIIIADTLQVNETIAPNLYALMIGVSDYKGDELDLKYAAKDATDISKVVAEAAKKLLNTDSREHVFMYNLTTNKERYQLPEKNSIKKTIEEIGKKSTANDILLIFFAGHGIMTGEGDTKQFYFLTADASSLSAGTAVKDAGISTAELTEWMKPQNIKAQKRILIFDACNSGQAINDFVKMGNKEQGYIAARNDDKSQQIKVIDKLNEKSGLFILSASATNQNAYEMGRYSQGLLTYSLLKAIKQQPDILEDGKYLNVSRWFNAAEKTVTDLSKENGARQQPQIVSNTNFNIGVVDDEVMAKIVLPEEKPLFAASNFQNSDEAVADDDLELSKMINLQLSDLASRGADSKIVYVTATNSPDAYSLSGRYTIKGNEITVTVNIKQNKSIRSKFEMSGMKDRLKELAEAVVEKATGMVK